MAQHPSRSPSLSVNRAPEATRLVHWNIKELDTQKLSSPDHPQVNAAASILGELGADLFSINEIHCDPTRDNLGSFLQRFPNSLDSYRLSPSNTGLRSDPQKKILDRSNFGWFPGQYATGFASCFPLIRTLEIQNLKWKDWEPNFDRSRFELGGVDPDAIELFDKSFIVHWIEIKGRPLALICLHAVPAFNFGQNKSPNAERNRAQLQFLRWYLTGEPKAPPGFPYDPLPAGQPFLAMGDFNSPLHDALYPGGSATLALLNHPGIHRQMAQIDKDLLQAIPRFAPTITYFFDGWDYQRLPQQLDYILVSKELRIHNLTVVFANPDRQIHGFHDPDSDLTPLLAAMEKPGRVASVQNGLAYGRPDQVAVVSVQKDYARLRAGSDHLPLVLDFSWN